MPPGRICPACTLPPARPACPARPPRPPARPAPRGPPGPPDSPARGPPQPGPVPPASWARRGLPPQAILHQRRSPSRTPATASRVAEPPSPEASRQPPSTVGCRDVEVAGPAGADCGGSGRAEDWRPRSLSRRTLQPQASPRVALTAGASPPYPAELGEPGSWAVEHGSSPRLGGRAARRVCQ